MPKPTGTLSFWLNTVPWTSVYLWAFTKPQREHEMSTILEARKWMNAISEEGKAYVWPGGDTPMHGECGKACWRRHQALRKAGMKDQTVNGRMADSLYGKKWSLYFPFPSSLCQETKFHWHCLMMTWNAVPTWKISSPFPYMWRWDMRPVVTSFNSF